MVVVGPADPAVAAHETHNHNRADELGEPVVAVESEDISHMALDKVHKWFASLKAVVAVDVEGLSMAVLVDAKNMTTAVVVYRLQVHTAEELILKREAGLGRTTMTTDLVEEVVGAEGEVVAVIPELYLKWSSEMAEKALVAAVGVAVYEFWDPRPDLHLQAKGLTEPLLLFFY